MQINALNFPSDLTSQVRQNTDTFSEAKTTKPKPEAPEKPAKEVEKADNMVKLKNTLAEYDISLRFSQDAETNQLVVNLIDERTGESVLQFPSEVSLKLAADHVKLQGQFVDKIQ